MEPSSLVVSLAPAEVPDPHEPRYCICNQVSYGEMVGCDNEDVCWILLYYFSLAGFAYCFSPANFSPPLQGLPMASSFLGLQCARGIGAHGRFAVHATSLPHSRIAASYAYLQCLKEWFHYACVGITEPPTGKWCVRVHFADKVAMSKGCVRAYSRPGAVSYTHLRAHET